MKTLLEVSDILNSLDADKDIVVAACREYLTNKMNPDSINPADVDTKLKIELLERYGQLIPANRFATILLEVSGAIIADIAETGEEINMLEAGIWVFGKEFMRSRVAIAAKLLSKDPDKSLAMIKALMLLKAKIVSGDLS